MRTAWLVGGLCLACSTTEPGTDIGRPWLNAGHVHWLAWSSDGATLFYADDQTLHSISAESSQPRDLLSQIEQPRLVRSAEGDKIFFVARQDRSLMRASATADGLGATATVGENVIDYIPSTQGNIVAFGDFATRALVVSNLTTGARSTHAVDGSVVDLSPDGQSVLIRQESGYTLIDTASGAMATSIPKDVAVRRIIRWEDGRPRAALVQVGALLDIATGEPRSLVPNPRGMLTWQALEGLSGPADRPAKAYLWSSECLRQKKLEGAFGEGPLVCAERQYWLYRADLEALDAAVVATMHDRDGDAVPGPKLVAVTPDGSRMAIYDGADHIALKELN
jgi:dipeptidyl aminopeptidase/acylaminoacyl peptidase